MQGTHHRRFDNNNNKMVSKRCSLIIKYKHTENVCSQQGGSFGGAQNADTDACPTWPFPLVTPAIYLKLRRQHGVTTPSEGDYSCNAVRNKRHILRSSTALTLRRTRLRWPCT